MSKYDLYGWNGGAWWSVLPPPVSGWYTTTDRTTLLPEPGQVPMTPEQVRRIVREEIADLPIPFHVPDVLPERTTDA